MRQEEAGRQDRVPPVAVGESVVEAMPDGVLLVDGGGTIRYANFAASRLFKYAKDELIGRDVSSLVPAPVRARHAGHVSGYARQRVARPMGKSADLRAVDRDGREFPVDIDLSPIDVDGTAFVCVTVRDVSERMAALRTAREQERRLRALFDENPCILFTLEETYRICEINDYGRDFFAAHSSQGLIDAQLLDFVYAADRAAVRASLERASARPGEVAQVHCRIASDRTWDCWLQLTIRVFCREDGRRYALVVAEDITKRLQLSKKLSYQATHDALTGLVNRLGFEQRIQQLLDAGSDDGAMHTLCFIDLDQFKVINDTCGHTAGDQLLREVARVLRAGGRRADIIARLGGDEFALVFPDCDSSRAQALIDRIAARVRAIRFNWSEFTFSVGMSVGLVEFRCGAHRLVDILQKADAACYAAKERGRGRALVYEEHDVELRRTQSASHWAAKLQRAIDEDELELWGQPIVPVHACPQQRPKVEVLLRLRGRDGVVIPPSEFLPAAERFGLAPKIDLWVIERALDWIDAQGEAACPSCSINLSGQSLSSPEFVSAVCRLLANRGAKTPIVFEVTETAAISNFDAALHLMSSLKAYGCEFALDDFGTGMTSFAYLKNIPAEYIKIAGSFIRNICAESLDYMIVQSIVNIAKSLSRHTIAEFVESADVLATLRELGVDFVQGYLMGRPVPLSELHAAPAWCPAPAAPPAPAGDTARATIGALD
ncbi:MAG TPA: EAL domain-containing protein [Gammaproteobacteria bacterium]|nr:EAL domain-containing protein [Gammaproteobacteria bacterium]